MTRRTGKVGSNEQAKTGGQEAAEQGTQTIQSRLQKKNEEVSYLVADNMQADLLMRSLSLLQKGYVGPKTSAILEALEVGCTAPLEDWGNQIEQWHLTPIALLPSSSESIPS